MENAERRKAAYVHAYRHARDPSKVDDLLQTACMKVLAGDWPWDREKRADLVEHLSFVMWSLGDRHRKSADARRMKLHDAPEDEDRLRDASADDRDADSHLERKLTRWMGGLRKDRANDPQCLRLLDSFESGFLRVEEQRVDTGWKLEDVRRVRRRLFDRAAIVMRTTPDDSGAYDVQGAP